MTALTPKSALVYRPLAPDVASTEPAVFARASRICVLPKHPSSTRVLALPYVRLLPLGLGMVLMLCLVVVGSLVGGWVQIAWDDLRYGRPRTFQMDAFVGHEQGRTPSHFIALNVQGQMEIIELPGGDATHAKIYLGPRIYGPGADLVPVTLRFA